MQIISLNQKSSVQGSLGKRICALIDRSVEISVLQNNETAVLKGSLTKTGNVSIAKFSYLNLANFSQ